MVDRHLKIGIVATEFPPLVGGMENHAAGLARALAADHQVTVFTRTTNTQIDANVEYQVRSILTGGIPDDIAALRKHHVDFWLVLNAGYARLASALSPPVFVYCHGNDFLFPWIRQSTTQTLLWRLMMRLPMIWRLAPRIRQTLAQRSVLRGLSDARIVFVNSKYTEELLKRTFPNLASRVVVSTPGVADHFFSKPIRPQGFSDKSPNKLRLLSVARLASAAPKKNVDNLIRAVATLKDEIPLELKIIGDGDGLPALRDLCHSLGVESHVSFLGYVPNFALPAHFDESDLFVLASHASLTDVESFGIVYAEAAARGVPALLSRSGGSLDAVSEGVSSVLVPDGQPHSIAAGIRFFSQNQQRFNEAAIREFAARFQWPVISKQMLSEIFGEIQNKSGKHQEK